MATTSNRWTVVKAFIDTLREHRLLVGVQVEPGWPGDEMQAELIWITDLTGQISMPFMVAGRKTRDDHFEIPLQIRVSNRANRDDTLSRVIQLVAAVQDILADDPTLGDLDSLVSIGTEEFTENEMCASMPEGHLGFAELIIPVHARLY
jgi:hypothetical protein